ncbi:hypothetical protein [Pedobacter rhodius]|uniref:Addiction module component n=1 Tax=Pedobacter rhodius TaxID=3004098 RepID=A0ABT4KT40_9SPHI|nr:hypothetical protein [Pedobacter sp. SJ11]MCZ4222087.1 hypothetical protein [Pedobacter sp. SJ11]
MATILENEMLSYFMQLNDADKSSIVKLLKTFIANKQENAMITIEQYNAEIDDAELEFQKGHHNTHNQFLKDINKW